MGELWGVCCTVTPREISKRFKSLPFVWQLVQANNKEQIKVLYEWPPAREIANGHMVSPRNTVMNKEYTTIYIFQLGTSCFDPSTQVEMDTKCGGQKECRVNVTVIDFTHSSCTDPSSYLEVIYVCLPSKWHISRIFIKKILMEIHLKMSSANWQPFCLSLNVFNHLYCCDGTDICRNPCRNEFILGNMKHLFIFNPIT